jgi:hypothetical protein
LGVIWPLQMFHRRVGFSNSEHSYRYFAALFTGLFIGGVIFFASPVVAQRFDPGSAVAWPPSCVLV